MRTILWLVCVLMVSGLGAWAGHDEAKFEKLDANHDGSLSKDEFSAGCKGSHEDGDSDSKSADDEDSDSKSDDGDKKDGGDDM